MKHLRTVESVVGPSSSGPCDDRWPVRNSQFQGHPSRRRGLQRLSLLGLMMLSGFLTTAQTQRDPTLGYLYPAGGQQGTTIQVKLAGQYLDGVTNVHVSGNGVTAAVVEHVKPLNGRQLNLLRDRLRELQRGLASAAPGDTKVAVRSETNTNLVEKLDRLAVQKEVADIRQKLANPKNRQRDNPQLSEDATLRVVLAPDAEPGVREVRLKAASGLSNPVAFRVGDLAEYAEKEPNDKPADAGQVSSLPFVMNGQIMPGDVDLLRLRLRGGTRLVVVASARELIPYLADAVPGWFQATLALYDADGKELAYADDYRFHPDPVLFYQISKSGEYVLEIKDALYRGREDFVYRLTVGELPFVTSIFPLGGPAGAQTLVKLRGWNLPSDEVAVDARDSGPGVLPVSTRAGRLTSNQVPFAVDTLPEIQEREANDLPLSAQRVTPPLIVNGRIEQPGDSDVFCFSGHAGQEIVAEVRARRLNAPLDSALKLTDAAGRQLAYNDDHEDKGAGLTTHQADSYFAVTLPADGTYYVHLGDAQHKGGPAYAYRLRLSPPQPDFELRVMPASVNARPGATVPLTVAALRKDGFAGDITLVLHGAPGGFALSGAWVPAHQDQVRLTLTVPPGPLDAPVSLRLEGRAKIGGQEVVRTAVPAEDRTQAFIYHHLVPASDLLVATAARGGARALLQTLDDRPVKIPVGGTVQVRLRARGRQPVEGVQLELDEPPDGIAIAGVSTVPGGVAVELRADAAKVQPGLKGNLIVDAFAERTLRAQNGGPRASRRPVPVGLLPALPFEIIERPERTRTRN